ncbi:MAG: agmatinase [Planctomycetes bacterium]|nr:agmatinase [Planctomycetota bacterium]
MSESALSGEFVLEKPNFLGLPERSVSLEGARFVVVPLPYERTTSYMKGTRLGPQAILTASRQIELYDEETGLETWKAGIHTLSPIPVPRDPAAYFRTISETLEPLIRAGKFIVAFGGEHSVTEGPLSAVSRVHPKVSVLHVDAHADLRREYEGSVYSHACAARRMMEYAGKIVQVGVRSVSEDERELCNSKRVTTLLMHESRDAAKLTRRVLEELTETVYVSIDLDGLDPSVIPGVGTPQPGGLGWYDLLDLLRAVIREKNVVACDLVELCPLDGQVISEFAAAKLAYRVMGYVHAKGGRRNRGAKARS